VSYPLACAGARQSVERICLAECLVTNVAGGLRLLEYDCVLLLRALRADAASLFVRHFGTFCGMENVMR
jgi:hypothetical protein